MAFIGKTETNVENKKLVYESIMSILAAGADNQDDMEVVKWGPLLQGMLVEIGVRALLGYAAGGYVGASIGSQRLVNFLESSAGCTVGEYFIKDKYKGELYNICTNGTLALLQGYVDAYVQNWNRMEKMVFIIGDILAEHKELYSFLSNIQFTDQWYDRLMSAAQIAPEVVKK